MKRSMRQNAGWRGLSVDLITDNPTEGGKDANGSKAGSKEGDLKEEYEIVEKDASLDGKVVKMIWQKSKLDKSKLRDIWCVYPPWSWLSVYIMQTGISCHNYSILHLPGRSAMYIRKAHSIDRRSHWGCGASTPSSTKRRRLDERPCLVVLTRGASGQVDVSLRGWILEDPFRSSRCDYVFWLSSDALSFRIYPPFLRRNQAAPLCPLASPIIFLAHLYLTHCPYLLRCFSRLSAWSAGHIYIIFRTTHGFPLTLALCSLLFISPSMSSPLLQVALVIDRTFHTTSLSPQSV